MSTKPYYQDARRTIYLGDCFEVLSDLSADCAQLLVSDIPYGKNYRGTGFRKVSLPNMMIAQDDGSFDVPLFIKLSLRVLQSMRHLYVFGPYDPTGLPMLCGVTELIWDKGLMSAGDVESLWATTHEKIWFAVNGKRLGKAAGERGNFAGRLRRASVLRYTRLNASAVDEHLTPKPLGLLRELIESSSHLGETVIDPCMGVGSVLEAADLEGRQAIGIEISERNCEVAARKFSTSAPLLNTSEAAA